MSKWKSLVVGVLGLLVVAWVLGSLMAVSTPAEGRALYYRSPMHPWVTSERPGQCTVCGMDLVPVFESSGSSAQTNWTVGRFFSDAEVTNATVRDLVKTIMVSGRLVPNRQKTRVLSAEVGGRIERVFVSTAGLEVNKGDPLYSIYSPELREAERDFHLLYQQSQMSHSSKITAEHSRLLKAMRVRLREFGLTSQQIAALPQKQDGVSTSDFLAPAAGLVAELMITDGDRVSLGQPLMRIEDLYHLWFEFDVYENEFSALEIGQKISIRTSGIELMSTISFINNKLDRASRSTTARADLRNPSVRKNGVKTRALTLGMFTEGQVELEVNDRLALPREAFLSDGKNHVVFVRDENGINRTEVEIGFRGDLAWEVVTGLSTEDEVIVNGNLLLESESRL